MYKYLKNTMLAFVGSVAFAASLLIPTTVAAAPSLTVTSPTPSQKLSSGSVTISGTASTGSAVTVSVDGNVIGQVMSDGSGNWSINANNLAVGSHSISAQAISSPDHLIYFGLNQTINVLNTTTLDSNDITPYSPSGITTTSPYQVLSRSSPVSGMVYVADAFGFGGGNIAPGLFNRSAPADPVPVVNYPANASSSSGDFSADGTKYYSPNKALDTVTVIDVATNTASPTPIAVGNEPYSGQRAPNGNIYVVNHIDNTISVISTASDSILKTVGGPSANQLCPSVNSLGGSVAFGVGSGHPYYYITCAADGLLIKLSQADDTIVDTFNIGGSPVSVHISNDNSRLMITGVYSDPGADTLRFINSTNGSSTSTITLPGDAITAVTSSSGRYVYVAVPGPSFNATSFQRVDLTDNSITEVSTPGVTPLLISDLDAETTSTSVDFSVLGATSSPLGETGQTISITARLSAIAVLFGLSVWALTRKTVSSSSK